MIEIARHSDVSRQPVDQSTGAPEANIANSGFPGTRNTADSSPVSDESDTVVLDAVSYTYDSNTPWAHAALHDVSVAISSGARLLVVGENGSGKSTLAWILAGMFEPTEGTALLGREPLRNQLHKVGFVIQHVRLQLLGATIADEFEGFGIKPPEANWSLNQMGLAALPLNRRLDELSVGQQRRVGMAVIFARSCPLVILDEPLAGLDARGSELVAEAVKAMPETTTVITVTHDLEASAALGSDVIELEKGSIAEVRRP